MQPIGVAQQRSTVGRYYGVNGVMTWKEAVMA